MSSSLARALQVCMRFIDCAATDIRFACWRRPVRSAARGTGIAIREPAAMSKACNIRFPFPTRSSASGNGRSSMRPNQKFCDTSISWPTSLTCIGISSLRRAWSPPRSMSRPKYGLCGRKPGRPFPRRSASWRRAVYRFQSCRRFPAWTTSRVGSIALRIGHTKASI